MADASCWSYEKQDIAKKTAPKSRERDGKDKLVYNQMIQITVRSNSILLELGWYKKDEGKEQHIEEISQMGNIDQLLNPDNAVTSRFNMS